jgi:hypothetical protein
MRHPSMSKPHIDKLTGFWAACNKKLCLQPTRTSTLKWKPHITCLLSESNKKCLTPKASTGVAVPEEKPWRLFQHQQATIVQPEVLQWHSSASAQWQGGEQQVLEDDVDLMQQPKHNAFATPGTAGAHLVLDNTSATMLSQNGDLK